MDFGKSAATFLDLQTDKAVRLHTTKHFHLQDDEDPIAFFNAIPDEELFDFAAVKVQYQPEDLPGRPLYHAVCSVCGEEVNDGRQVEVDGDTQCKACAQGAYYQVEGAL